MEDLLKQSHFVTLHVPDTPKTRGMITKAQIDLMPKGSYLLNASRGHVVVLEDLAEAIKSKHLAGAYVDVYPQEPNTNPADFECPLRGLPNVLLSPHIGTARSVTSSFV